MSAGGEALRLKYAPRISKLHYEDAVRRCVTGFGTNIYGKSIPYAYFATDHRLCHPLKDEDFCCAKLRGEWGKTIRFGTIDGERHEPASPAVFIPFDYERLGDPYIRPGRSADATTAPLSFCPFCGEKFELQEVRVVLLEYRDVTVPKVEKQPFETEDVVPPMPEVRK